MGESGTAISTLGDVDLNHWTVSRGLTSNSGAVYHRLVDQR